MARRRSEKRSALLRQRGVRSTYTPDEVRAVMEPWLAMGLTREAIRRAAGVQSDKVMSGGPVLRSTYEALRAVTEDRLIETTWVWSDLTQTRLRSLMAGGHRIAESPAVRHPLWRDRKRIYVRFARDVRDYYAEVAPTPGTNKQTASRARGNGYVPPEEWDDPGTLAWPLGSSCELAIIDEVVIERLLAGVHTPTSTRLEREEAMRRHIAEGGTEWELAKLHAWPHHRYLPPELKEVG